MRKAFFTSYQGDDLIRAPEGITHTTIVSKSTTVHKVIVEQCASRSFKKNTIRT